MKAHTFILTILMLAIAGATANDGRKANEAYKNGEFELAEELYMSAIEANPDEALLYFNLGNTRARLGKVEEAIEAFMQYKEMVSEPEKKAKAEYNIGTMLAENEQWKPAVNHFKTSLKLNPVDMDSKHNFERALAEQNKEEENEQQQQNQDDQTPPEPSDYAKAMKKQAERLVEQRKYQEAYDLMMQALSVDETVRAFNDFIERTKNVAEINSN